MKYLITLLVVIFGSFPTLVLATNSKPQEFLSFNAWKTQKIKAAKTNHQKLKVLKGKNPRNQALKNDIQSAQLAVQTAENLRLDDYLAIYWAPRSSQHSIEKVALGLNPTQVKELLAAYMNSSGLNKTKSFQPLMNERISSQLTPE